MASPGLSPSPGPSNGPANRHAPTASEAQRMQLERLLKDPTKPVHVPQGPKEKTIRPPREMMKNVQGSSAGAGSGEFHVYKAARRREYERLKMMDETTQKEATAREFEDKQKQWREAEEAKTSKNRAKRQKKKERARQGGGQNSANGNGGTAQDGSKANSDAPLKKRRLVNGAEMLFKRPGEEGSDDEDVGPQPVEEAAEGPEIVEEPPSAPAANATKLTIIEDD